MRSTITATFSEEVTGVESATFAVSGPDGAVAGTVSYDPATSRAVFLPDAPLRYGASYSVALSTAIADGAGNRLATPATLSFDTAPLPAPVTISGDTTSLLGQQAVAYNGSGDALALWISDNGTVKQVYYSYLDHATGSWSPESLVPGGGDRGAFPSVAAQGKQFLAAWVAYDASNNAGAKAGLYDGSTSAWATTRLGWAGVGKTVVAASSSDFMVVWDESYRIKARRYLPGSSTWEATVTAGPNAYTWDPELATDGTGYCVTYRKSPGIEAAVYSARWITPVTISANGFYPKIAGNPAGTKRYAVVYWQPNATGRQIDNRFYDGTTWEAAWRVDPNLAFSDSHGVAVKDDAYQYCWIQNNSLSTPNPRSVWRTQWVAGVIGPNARISSGTADCDTATIGGSGGTVIAWREWDGTRWRVKAWDSVSASVATLDDGVRDCLSPLVTRTSAGASLTWVQDNGTAFDRMRTSFKPLSPAAAWGSANNISSTDLRGDALNAKMAADAAGTILAVWQQFNRGRWEVQGAFSRQGAWGAPFTVVTGGELPAVASNGTSFRVLFHGRFQDPEWGLQNGARAWTGGGWLPVEKVNVGNAQPQGIDLAANPSGYAAMWLEYRDPGNMISPVVCLSSGDGWGTAETLENLSGSSWGVDIQGNGTGWACLWGQYEGDNYSGDNSVWASLDSGSGWSQADTIESIAGTNPYSLQLASEGIRYLAAWEMGGLVVYNLHDGTGWTGESSYSGYAPALASGEAGYLMAWPAYLGPSSYAVRSKAFTAGSWEDLSETATPSTVKPAVATAALGEDYTLAYTQRPAATYSLMGQSRRGTMWGAPFAFETLAGTPSLPVALGSSGKYNAAWAFESATTPGVRVIRALTGY